MQRKQGTDLEHSDRVRLERSGVDVTVLGPRPADSSYSNGGWWAQSDDGRSWKLYNDDTYLVIGRDDS